MKKCIWVLLLMFPIISASAQHKVGSATIQPKIGLNISNLTHNDGADSRTEFTGGVELEYQFTKQLAFALGLVYSPQGSYANDLDGNVPNGYKVKSTKQIDYLNVPIVANLYLLKGFAVKLGIQPGFNVKANLATESKGRTENHTLYDVKWFDFSIPVGLSYEYKNFVADARYNMGFTKVIDGTKSKNKVFQFTFGYKFNL